MNNQYSKITHLKVLVISSSVNTETKLILKAEGHTAIQYTALVYCTRDACILALIIISSKVLRVKPAKHYMSYISVVLRQR